MLDSDRKHPPVAKSDIEESHDLKYEMYFGR